MKRRKGKIGIGVWCGTSISWLCTNSFKETFGKVLCSIFYCVFLHRFHCQNNLMWAEYLRPLILFKFFDMSISSQKQGKFYLLDSSGSLCGALWQQR